MQIQLESTTKVVELNGVQARVWEGRTASGINVHCFITRLAVSIDEDPSVHEHFTQELQECKQPSKDVEAYPLKMII